MEKLNVVTVCLLFVPYDLCFVRFCLMVRDKFHYEIWLRAILPRYFIQKVYSAYVTQAVVHSD